MAKLVLDKKVKIIDGLKLKGLPAEIPETTKKKLPEFFVDMGYKKGVEVGVYTGDFTKILSEAGLTVWGIDPFIVYPGFDHMTESRRKRQEELYHKAKKRLSRFKNATLIRKMSMEAIDNFEDGSLDFVYIDANHTFRYVAEDIFEWEKKVRAGGVVSGHDYKANTTGVEPHIFQVRPVVEAFVKAFKIKNYYLVGDLDHASSWFWIKE